MISNLSKPEIKGRGFVQTGNNIIETQTYYTKPENDWVFDETLKMTYENPIFLEQKKIRNENVDSTGFVAQYKLKDFVEDVEEDDSATKTDEDSDNDDEFDEFDLNDFKEDDDVSTMYERMQKSKKASNSTSDSISKSHRMQHSTEQKGSDDTDKKIKFNIKVKKDF